MSRQKSLEDCHKSEDFIKYAEQRGARVRNGHGSHIVICTDEGSCPIPHHGNQELQTGTRCKIMKIFAIIGLAVMIAIYVSYLP
jgi:predicted RNA binding protein YcfA (HicA-like mRNA interferase family)